MKIKQISPQENNYLKMLTSIVNMPKRLYYIGTLPESRLPTVAVIGTRRPTSYGREVTFKLAGELARKGFVIVSGLALGIDAIAHQAALDNNGLTIAVLGNGLDYIYPATNKNLGDEIVKSGGAIISEYKPYVLARDFQFLERNRIVSGVSDAILVTEATLRSGTASTVARALEQGKEVFVVPGNITSPLSAGCNRLIKQGAHPVTCVEDIIEILAPEMLTKQATLPLGANPTETMIIKLLQSGIRDGDELQIKSGLNISDFSQTLTLMEISGVIRSLGGNQWTLR